MGCIVINKPPLMPPIDPTTLSTLISKLSTIELTIAPDGSVVKPKSTRSMPPDNEIISGLVDKLLAIIDLRLALILLASRAKDLFIILAKEV